MNSRYPFSCVNISRFIDVDSEEALTGATDKFVNRYLIVEKLAEEKEYRYGKRLQ